MTLNEIISNEIDKYLAENVFPESKKNSKGKKAKKKRKGGKNAIKIGNAWRKSIDYDEDKKNDPNINAGDEEELVDVLKSGVVNVAAIAHEMRPDLTKTGSQSELRKKINHEKSDSGATYHLKKKEARRLRKVLNRHGLI